jgi:hypothetical protein
VVGLLVGGELCSMVDGGAESDESMRVGPSARHLDGVDGNGALDRSPPYGSKGRYTILSPVSLVHSSQSQLTRLCVSCLWIPASTNRTTC